MNNKKWTILNVLTLKQQKMDHIEDFNLEKARKNMQKANMSCAYYCYAADQSLFDARR